MTESPDRGASVPTAPGIVLVLTACVVALGLLAAVNSLVTPLRAFDVNGELTDGFYVPALFSGMLLLALRATGAVVGRSAGPSLSRVWAGLSALFLFAAVDDLVQVHERLERSTGVDWQVLYLSLFVLIGGLWAVVLLRERWREGFGLVWLWGAAAWGIAQILEDLSWRSDDRPVGAFAPMSGAEELLEMLGTIALIWGTLPVLRGTAPAAQRSRPREARQT